MMSATHFSLLSYDVLLHLVKFIEPVDCFNLLLSGILKGFENVNKGIDLQKRIRKCAIVFGPSRFSICKLDIRSFSIIDPNSYWFCREYESNIPHLIFERLVAGGFLTNNRRLSVTCHVSYIPQYCQDICSMKKLEILKLYYVMKLEQLVPLFGSCPKLVELDLALVNGKELEIDEQQKNVLVQGFQRLELLKFQCIIDIHSLPVIQEMLNWLRDCRSLFVRQDCPYKQISLTRINSLAPSTLNPTSAQSLQSLTLADPPIEFIKWILDACSNIHTLHLIISREGLAACVKIGCLKKLRQLKVSGSRASHFKKIFRNCHQVEILKLEFCKAKLQDFAELNATNMKEIELMWEEGPSIEEVLLVLMKYRQLRKLKISVGEELVPTCEVLTYFIMVINHLEYLYLSLGSNHQLKHLRDKILESILPSRPNFKFEVGRGGEVWHG